MPSQTLNQCYAHDYTLLPCTSVKWNHYKIIILCGHIKVIMNVYLKYYVLSDMD